MSSSIFLVEDDLALADVLEALLVESGYKVRVFNHAIECMAALRHEKPLLIISDLNMTEINGFELLSWMRKQSALADIPFMIITAEALVEKRIEGYNIGANDFINKPFRFDELLARIRSILSYSEMVRWSHTNFPKLQETIKDNQGDALFLKIKEYVFNHEADSMDYNRMAEYCGISRSTLQKKVKRITGQPLSAVVNTFKIDYSLELLKNSNLSVKEIAKATGFNSQVYFQIVFKKVTGKSPLQALKEINRRLLRPLEH